MSTVPATDEPGLPAAPLWCGRCGGAAAEGDHGGCRRALELEPPRYCASCRRRMKVQVTPDGWQATCVEHGVSGSSTWRA